MQDRKNEQLGRQSYLRFPTIPHWTIHDGSSSHLESCFTSGSFTSLSGYACKFPSAFNGTLIPVGKIILNTCSTKLEEPKNKMSQTTEPAPQSVLPTLSRQRYTLRWNKFQIISFQRLFYVQQSLIVILRFNFNNADFLQFSFSFAMFQIEQMPKCRIFVP